ncbi:MAG: formate dehydrogenase subunit gamma [Ardenticatenaceae bacterium]|nr:formate dehydrogenase subunit gamma [Ardenticatenaceae bacterium]
MATRWIRRFSTVQQWWHWIFALSFILATVTGVFLYIPQFAAFTIGAAGEASRLLHRVGAAGLVLAVLIYLIFGFRDFVADMREVFADAAPGERIRWLSGAFTRYYWGGEKGDMPDEGRYNAGQTLNYGIQVVGFIVLLVTGLVMWFGVGAVLRGLFQTSVILHDIAAIIVVGFFLLHLYLSTLHPMTKESITGMVTGMVTEEYARTHHPRWYEEVSGEETS